MTIAAILRAKGDAVVHVTPNITVRALAALLSERRIGAVPVLDGGGAVIGIVSERDVVRTVAAHGGEALDWTIEQVMTRAPITVAPATSLLACLSLMTQRRVRHLPVLDGERLVGFVSIGDLVKARIDRIESEAEAMRSYIAS